MTRRLGTTARVVMVAALALLLTGCLKLDMDLRVAPNDTVSGSVIFAVSKDVLELTGGSAEDLLGSDSPFPSDVQGVTSEPYDDADFAGQKFNFDAVPIAQFTDPTDPEALAIVREGDTFKVTGVLDLSQGLTGATGATGGTGAAAFFESAEIRVAITFPGEVVSGNGTIEGNTITWTPKFGDRLDIAATGSAIDNGKSGGGGSSSSLMIILIAVAAVVVVAIVVFVMMSKKKKGVAAVAAAPEGEAMGEAMGEAQVAAPTMTPPAAEPPPATPEAGPGQDDGTMPPPPPPAVP